MTTHESMAVDSPRPGYLAASRRSTVPRRRSAPTPSISCVYLDIVIYFGVMNWDALIQENTMKMLRQLWNRAGQPASRLDRYYAGIARPGAGYPTADEARRDLRQHDRSAHLFGWTR